MCPVSGRLLIEWSVGEEGLEVCCDGDAPPDKDTASLEGHFQVTPRPPRLTSVTAENTAQFGARGAACLTPTHLVRRIRPVTA